MARQNINKGTLANDGTGDTLRIAAGKINDNFGELYQLLGGDSAQVTNKLSLADSGVVYYGLTHNTVLGMIEGSSKTTIMLPGTSGTVALVGGTQTLANKTLASPILTTPQINDTSSDHQYIVAVNELTADRTITLPLLTTSDEFTFNAHNQTLTNKTLTTPTISSPNITTAINDANTAEIIKLAPTVSAVNEIQISNAATNGVPQVAGTGTDTNVGLGLSGTGNGLIHVQSGIRYVPETIDDDAAISPSKALTIFEAGGAINCTLANGTQIGETKTLANIGTGEVTITPATFQNGTTLHLRANALVKCVWIDNTDGWLLMSEKTYASSDAAALVYVA
jgi:hypothetical protein